MATSFVLGAASCASKDVNKIAPKAKTVTTTATAITAIDFKKEVTGHTAYDNTGLVVSTFANRPVATEDVPDPAITSYTHKLFDMKANAYVSGVEVVAKVDVGDEDATYYAYNDGEQAGSNVIRKLNDGLYYVKKTEYRRTKANDIWSNWKKGDTKYDIFSRSGVVVSGVEGEIVNGMFVQDNGTRIYVDFQGNIVKEEDPLANILVWGNKPTEVGEYLFYDENVYTKDGEYVRKFNPTYEFNLSAAEKPMAMWSVGSKYFMQTLTLLPENEKKYDVMMSSRIELDGNLGGTNVWFEGENSDGAQKYNVTTYCYDVDKEKVKEVDFDYFVYDGESYDNKDVAILWCAEIVDKEISQVAFVQAFNEKGKVAVDLQKLAPGATDYTYYTDYAVLTNAYTGIQTVVKAKKAVGTFVAGTVNYKNNIAYKNDDNAKNLYIYDLDGTLKKTVHYTYFENLDDGNFYYQTKDSVCVYDTMKNTEKTICSLDSGDSVSKPSDAYIIVTNTMDKEQTVYFLMTDTPMVSVDTEKFEMSVETVVSYSANGNSGVMVKIETTSKAPETADTNYANRTIATTFVSVEKK